MAVIIIAAVITGWSCSDTAIRQSSPVSSGTLSLITIMHLSTAVRTENLTHKRICLALCVYPAFGLSKLLHHIPCFSVNDRLMGIRKDHYLVTVISYSSLILIGKLLCTEIHSISHIFRFSSILTTLTPAHSYGFDISHRFL